MHAQVVLSCKIGSPEEGLQLMTIGAIFESIIYHWGIFKACLWKLIITTFMWFLITIPRKKKETFTFKCYLQVLSKFS